MLAGKRVVIFGGSSGMGKATAKSTLRDGAFTYILGRDRVKLEVAKEEILKEAGEMPDAGRRLQIAEVDLTNENSVQHFFNQYENHYFDHLVITAGPSNDCSSILGEEGFHKLREQFDIKFFAQLSVVSFGAEKLADGGSIVLTSGALAKRPGKGGAALGTVNAALDNIVKGLANDLGPRLRINSVSPGLTDTELFHGIPKEARDAMFAGFGKAIPAGRAGKPEDVAHAIQFLLENSFITGATIDIDGGAFIRP